jgi:hypothetical protein
MFNKINKYFQLKNIIKFFIYLCIIIIFILLLFINESPLGWNEFINYFIFYSISFTILFYCGCLFLLYISLVIYQKRQEKILRKLANFQDEIENLYNFINNFYKSDFSVYQYQKLLQYVNSYIIEKNNEILCSLNVIYHNNILFLFDFFANNPLDYDLMLNFLEKHLLTKKIDTIIFITKEKKQSDDLIFYLNSKLQNNQWIYSTLYQKNLDKIISETNPYILKSFYRKIEQNEYYILKKLLYKKEA